MVAREEKGELTVAYLEHEGTRLRSEIEAADAQVSAAQQVLATAQARVTAALTSVANAQSQIPALQSSAVAADSRVADLDRQVAAHRENEPEPLLEGEDGGRPHPNPAWRIWKRQLESLTALQNQAQADAAAAHGRLTAGQEAVSQAQAELQVAQNLATDATLALQTAQSASAAARLRLAELERWQLEIARDPLDRPALEQTAADLSTKTRALEESLTLARFGQEDAEANLAALIAQRQTLMDLLTGINASLPPAQAELQAAQAAAAQASDELFQFLGAEP
jgi:chromosome segregation ATPase